MNPAIHFHDRENVPTQKLPPLHSATRLFAPHCEPDGPEKHGAQLPPLLHDTQEVIQTIENMSEERLKEFEGKLAILGTIAKLGWALIAGAFALGVWVTILEVRQRTDQQDIANLKAQYEIVSLWKAETSGNRYSGADHIKFASDLSASLNTYDKRITRLEDATIGIKDDLVWIKTHLTEDRNNREERTKP